VRFQTKPALARVMLTRALDVGVAASWVAGGEVDGAGPRLRAELEARGMGCVLAVACGHQVPTGAGSGRADALAARVPARAWQRLSAGRGAKGHRWHDWAFIQLGRGGRAGHAWLLVRRNPNAGALACSRCFVPRPVPLAVLVGVAGRRWTVEETSQSGKGLAGLDEHQVRRWTSWYRWATLAMLAHALLAAAAAAERARPTPPGLIALTCNELQHLFAALVARPVGDLGHRLRWSVWRRRQQARARTCHYQRQAARPP